MSTERSTKQVLFGVLRSMRPRQWVKNVLVFAAPGAAGVLHQPAVLGRTALVLISFCLAAGGTYLLNDAADAEADRRHPKKRHRPVAAGTVPVSLAHTAGWVSLVAAGVSAAVINPATLVALGCYMVLTTLYTKRLKHTAVVEMVVVAAGFVLRAVGGATATSTPISAWFFVVVSAAALLMIASKRTAELAVGESHRKVLAEYTESFLLTVRTASLGLALAAYCIWAFAVDEHGEVPILAQISLAPFTIALLRWSQLADRGEAGSPEDVILHDRLIQICGAIWVAVFALALYL